MTKQQIKAEFNRWIDANRPDVWRKTETTDWELKDTPFWLGEGTYIVDDKHAKLRKLQIDKPHTKFEYYDTSEAMWMDCFNRPMWNIDTEYLIKPKEWYEYPDMVGKPVWVRDFKDAAWVVDVFKEYLPNENLKFRCAIEKWRYAKPVKCEDLADVTLTKHK